mmetsp:Transcript_11615/g.35918  ORF Transcript_11615/g.35918 Transcript_11615/m.35918 type:complete len:219 (-) Transcript_11615:319-975(-)
MSCMRLSSSRAKLDCSMVDTVRSASTCATSLAAALTPMPLLSLMLPSSLSAPLSLLPTPASSPPASRSDCAVEESSGEAGGTLRCACSLAAAWTATSPMSASSLPRNCSSSPVTTRRARNPETSAGWLRGAAGVPAGRSSAAAAGPPALAVSAALSSDAERRPCLPETGAARLTSSSSLARCSASAESARAPASSAERASARSQASPRRRRSSPLDRE